MISTRLAISTDVDQISAIFHATYGSEYPYQKYYNEENLKKIVYSDDTIIIVAVQGEKILGTASVVLEIGAFADLSGEFGRLAVHPDARGKGIGKMLMDARIKAVEDRLHIAISEPRIAHSFSQRIAEKNGFTPVGLLPIKHKFDLRESVALYAQHFGDCLSLRRNNPRIIAEAYLLADAVMDSLKIRCDAIVVDSKETYPNVNRFSCEEMTADGYSSLLRFERGRFQNREIFGPMRLHYGMFKIRSKKSTYLLAKDGNQTIGGIGFTHDELEESIKIFELVSVTDDCIYYLLKQLDLFCERLGVKYVEVDVSAYAPKMQKTLSTLGFRPAAYIPAMVFHNVERLDVLRMVKLFDPYMLGAKEMTQQTSMIEGIVARGFVDQQLDPELAAALKGLKLFRHLDRFELGRVSAVCSLHNTGSKEVLFNQGDKSSKIYVVLKGNVKLSQGSNQIGEITPGGSIGELSILREEPHSVTATADENTTLASVDDNEFNTVLKQNPEIALKVLKNMACELGEKLSSSNQSNLGGTTDLASLH